jgi:hypothetical protein
VRGWLPRWWEAETWDTFRLHQKFLLLERAEERERLERENLGGGGSEFGRPPPLDQLARLPGWQSQN